MKKKQSEPVDGTLEALKKIESYLHVLVRLQLAPVYARTINTTELQKLYSATGTKSISELSKHFQISTGKISMLWQKWEQAGLLSKDGAQYVKVV